MHLGISRFYVDDIIIEKGAINQLPDILQKKYGQYKNIAMVCDDNTYQAAGKKVEELVPGITTIKLDPNGYMPMSMV